MLYRIGLDIGITSVGYAVLQTELSGEPNRIIDAGSRIFDAAENEKDGASLALPRREARSARRRNRRHRHRMDRIKSLLQSQGMINKLQLEELYSSSDTSDIYMIRYEALERLLDNTEFARLLIHLAQRRGFKSNRQNDEKDGEGGKLLAATEANKNLLQLSGYRTVGELLYKDEKFLVHKRNKGGDYSNTFLRSQIVDEINTIFDLQQQFGNSFATEQMKNSYLHIFEGQRSFDEGPASGPYSGNQIEKMIGSCTFEKEEQRAVKASYTFEYYNLLCKVNSIRISIDGVKQPLTASQHKEIIELCHIKESVTYAVLRKTLELNDGELFNITYGSKEVEEVEKSTKFNFLKSYHVMRRAFDKIKKGYIHNISEDTRDEIAKILTYYKGENKIKEALVSLNLNKFEHDVVMGMGSFSRVAHLSLKAMKNIIPHLQRGNSYDKAAELAGYDFRSHDSYTTSLLLPRLPDDCYDITSPVVKRAIGQSIKVINAIIKKYGSPVSVNIELARELSKNKKERSRIDKEQRDNQKNNESVIEDIKELGSIYNPSGQDIIKYRLWKEQQGICLYTGAPLEIERLFEPGYSEIDHIIPYSISFNDSYKNKVLVTAKANREKGNKLPLQYVQSRDDFIGLTNTLIHDKAKRNNLLKEQIAPEDESALKDRSLQDTQFISRFMLNYIRDHLLFNNEVEKKIRVRAVNGRITAYLRKRWGLNKIRGNGDLHHAMDAVVVGCVTQGAINYLTSYSKYKELEWYIPTEDTEKRHFPTPWPEFKREVDFRFSTNPVQLLFDSPLRNYADVNIAAIKPFFVSRRVRKKTTGQAHKETIRAYREYDGIMQTVTKTSIKNLKYDAVNDEIIGYYNPSSDRLLYELLKERLRQFGGDAQKAFPEGFVHKPTPKGCVNTDSPPIVKKVKILDKSTLNVEVNDGVAGNGDMVRIDIFHVENEGYYFVPIYVSDMVKPVLPNRASVAGKPYSEWKEMREEDFIFSLYPNDLVKITAKKGMKFARVFDDATIAKDYIANEILLYYKKAGISTGSIALITHDNSYIINSCGIKTLVSLEKYYVDVLGNVYKAPKEKRGR